MTRVIFFQVRNNALKLQKITQSAQYHFEKNELFTFFVEDERAEQFLDDLLWKMPNTSFLPHEVATDDAKEKILITKTKKNFQSAKIAFNLCPTPLSIEGPFKIIYEFEDMTAPNKQKLSTLRLDAYKKMGFSIESQ